MLWLNYIQVVGSWGENVTLPAVDFDGDWLKNRVDYPSDQPEKAMPMRRITTIQNGLGGEIHVHYGHASAAATCPNDGSTSTWESGKHWDTNTQECFRVDYKPDGATALTHGVFHKYVVTSVDQVDTIGGSPTQTTTYDYLGDPAWHYDDDLATPSDWQEWGDWRGYATVRATTGAGAAATVDETTYFRGMDGDHLMSGTRSVSVTDYDGNTYPDNHALAGYTLQTRHYQLGAGGARTELSSERYTYWDSGVLADGPGLHNAHMIRTEATYGRQRRADGSWRQTGSKQDGFNAANGGLPTREQTWGEIGDATDNTCTELTYAQNTTDWRWMLNYPETVELHSGDADAQSNQCPGPVVARAVTLYDGAAAPGSADKPIDGNPTELRKYWNDTSYSTEKKTYDAYGRVVTDVDPLGHTTTTSYSPAAGWPVDGTVTTNPLGQATTTYTSRAFGVTVRSTDPNRLVTSTDYDGAGRLRRVWLPTEPKPNGPEVPPPAGAVPSYEFTYHTTTGSSAANSQPAEPTVVTSRQLQTLQGGSQTWLTSYTYLDGFGRTREVQQPSPSGSGRTVTVTTYDDNGRVRGTSAPFYNSTAPGDDPTLLLNPAREAIPSWTEQSYDGLGRQTDQALYGNGQLQWETKTANYGDGNVVTPPRGAPTAYWNDGYDRPAKVQENFPAGADVPPAGLPTTSYAYTPRGDLGQITDPAGNVTRYGYDWLGRRVSSQDPDAGAATTAYDAGGDVTSTVDATGRKLSYSYDALNRRRTQWAGDIGGAKLAEWTYDTLAGAAGQPVATIRYVGGAAYRSEVTSYDPRYRVTGRKVTVPAQENGLAGTYQYGYGYDRADHQISTSYPAAGDLPAETVTTGYSATGQPVTLGLPGYIYVSATAYSGSGQLRDRSYGAAGGVRRSYGYEDTGARRLTSVQTTVGDVRAQFDAYGYDDSSNVTSITDQALPSPQRQCFYYDGLQRLTAAWTTAGACSAGSSGADRTGPDPYQLGYAYDPVGDITSVTSDGAARTYRYPAPGPTAVRPHAATAAGADSYGYDAAGRMTSRTVAGTPATLAWDETGALASVTTGPPGAATTTSFLYDADGSRMIRRDPGSVTLYLEGQELQLAGGVVTAKRYYTAAGATVAVRDRSGVTWLGADQQNSTQVAVDATSDAVSRQRYLPYGSHRDGRDDITVTDRGFVGRTEDAGTGLDLLDARYYDPSLGRFISPDPTYDEDSPQSLNPYGYGEDNPVSQSDPSGMGCVVQAFFCTPDKPKHHSGGGGGGSSCLVQAFFCGGGVSQPTPNPVSCLTQAFFCSSQSEWLVQPAYRKASPDAQRMLVATFRKQGYQGSDSLTNGDLLNWAKESEDGWDVYCQNSLDMSVDTCKNDPFSGNPDIYEDPVTASVHGCLVIICGEYRSQGTHSEVAVGSEIDVLAPAMGDGVGMFGLRDAYRGRHRKPTTLLRNGGKRAKAGVRMGVGGGADFGLATAKADDREGMLQFCFHLGLGGCVGMGDRKSGGQFYEVDGGLGLGGTVGETYPVWESGGE
jgi:RHS repeat-associated protein